MDGRGTWVNQGVFAFAVLLAQTTIDAPADRYFGRLQMSSLRVRYETMQLKRRYETHELLPEETEHLLVLTQDSFDGWRRAYPRDTWLPFDRLRNRAALRGTPGWNRANASGNALRLRQVAVSKNEVRGGEPRCAPSRRQRETRSRVGTGEARRDAHAGTVAFASTHADAGIGANAILHVVAARRDPVAKRESPGVPVNRRRRNPPMKALPTYRDIAVERDDDFAFVTMNRPEKRNALSLQMMRELDDALAAIGADRSVRVVLLRGEGHAFSAGHDLRELLDRGVAEYRTIFDACVALMARLVAIPQPVIAEVAKVATAAGCQLVAACDLAVASTEATFATPGVRIGLFCSTPMVALTRAIGRKRAMEMLLTGEPIDAATALAWGLVNRVVAPDELRAQTLALARRIAEASPTIVGIGKAAFYEQIDLDQPAAYEYTKEVMTRNALEADAREGIAAFLEKRAPKW